MQEDSIDVSYNRGKTVALCQPSKMTLHNIIRSIFIVSIVIYLVEPLGTWGSGLVMSNDLQIMGFFVSFSSKHLLMQFEPFGRAHWGGFVNG